MLKCNNSFDLKNSKIYKPSEVSKMRFCELPDGSYKMESDVCLLFNQQRIVDTVGIGNAQKFFDRLETNYKVRGIDTSKLSDEQLLKFIKDKNIQTPSELMAWSEYLMNQMQQEADEYKDEVNHAVQKEVANQAKKKADAQEELQKNVKQALVASQN